MALQGTLDTFALADLVRLLATTSKTGELAIAGDRGSGRLWFADGQLVGGEPAADDLVDVVFALLRLQEGDFAFDADVVPDDAREPRSALDVLIAAEARLEEWRPVEELVPSPAVTLTLRGELSGDEVTIGRDVWRRLVAVGGGTTAGAFGDSLGLDEQATGFAIRDLVEAGLVEVGDEAEPDVVAEPVADVVAEPVVEGVADVVAEPVAEGVAEPVAEPVAATPPAPVVEPAPAPLPTAVDGDVDEAVPADTDAEPVEVPPVLGVVPDPPYSFGSWGEGPVPAPEEQVDPSALGPWEPLGAPATAEPEPGADALPTPEAIDGAPPHDDLGSYAVDLDTQMGGATAGHSYLGIADDGASLPEPLLGAEAPDPVGPEALPAEPGPTEPTAPADELAARRDGAQDDMWSASQGGADDLGVPLDSLSPAAARALAAAASADDGAADNDAGRRVLRRIISTGKG